MMHSAGKAAKINAFAGMLRWPNLVMMAAGMVLTRYCIFMPVYSSQNVAMQMGTPEFVMLVLATLLIGAGGYVVNDILDADLDDLNKPGVNHIGQLITEKLAWRFYYGLNIAGVLLGTALAWLAGKPELGILFLLVATSLYYYSLKYKYLPLWGNLVVALLTALTVVIVWLFEFFFLKNSPADFITISPSFPVLNQFVLGYGFLAFFFSIIREVIKDAQDVEGDRRFGCRTIPVVLGEIRTRWLVAALLFLAVIMITLVQVYLFQGYRLLAIFLGIVSILAVYSLIRLLFVRNDDVYRRLSGMLKAMLATGLVSMVFLWFPN